MSIHTLNSINPFFRVLKKNIRRWILNILFFVSVLLVCLYVAGNDYVAVATITFIIYLIILIIIYFKNINKNALLKASIVDYKDVERIDVFVEPYRKLFFYSKLIFIFDFILFPLTLPLKLAFWVNYRKLKSRFKKLRKMILKGEKVLDNESTIENDPFYDFLMREGLYETRRQSAEERKEEEDDEQKQETDSKQSKVILTEESKPNEDIKKDING